MLCGSVLDTATHALHNRLQCHITYIHVPYAVSKEAETFDWLQGLHGTVGELLIYNFIRSTSFCIDIYSPSCLVSMITIEHS
jgi:hypothetical protein